ncbi:hypothetical protein [Candidatus Deferrimicrobium sp.]
MISPEDRGIPGAMEADTILSMLGEDADAPRSKNNDPHTRRPA